MANATFTKGSKVEVCSNDPGFYGAWYVATFEKEIEASPTKKRASNKKKAKKISYLVTYDTLLNDADASKPLTEAVDPSFVRPAPPRNISRNNGGSATEVVVAEDGDGGGEFEVNDVVDADLREGWWIGVVKSVIVDGEMRKYVVSFEDPPEEFEFERCKLRFHVDWIDRRWMIPPKKTPEQKLGEQNAPDDAASGFITPCKLARKTDLDNKTDGPPSSAKKNTRSRKRSESNSAADSCVTSSRNKRDDSRLKRLRSSAGSNGNTKVSVSALVTDGSNDIHQDSLPVDHEIIITEKRESGDRESHEKRKRGRTPKLVIKKPIGLQQDGHGVTTDIDEQPLSIWLQGMQPLSLLKKQSRFSPDRHLDTPKQAIVNNAQPTTDYQQDWPFIKRSPIWAMIEPLDLYLTPPQKPHFSPLKTKNEDCREGLAIAHMVTFGNLVQRLSGLQVNDPCDIINNSLETLCELETHGFDVGPIRARLTELLSLKSKVCEQENTRNEVEKEIEKRDHEKSLVEKDMDGLKVKLQELKEKMVQTASMQKMKEEEIRKLQSELHLVSNQINDLELAFGKLAATPL